jgi:hypothetical protein
MQRVFRAYCVLEILQAIIFFAAWSLVPLGRRFWRSQNRDIVPDAQALTARDLDVRKAAEASDRAIDRAGEILGLIAMALVWAADFWLLPRLFYN